MEAVKAEMVGGPHCGSVIDVHGPLRSLITLPHAVGGMVVAYASYERCEELPRRTEPNRYLYTGQRPL